MVIRVTRACAGGDQTSRTSEASSETAGTTGHGVRRFDGIDGPPHARRRRTRAAWWDSLRAAK
jgi:hypothetical protein